MQTVHKITKLGPVIIDAVLHEYILFCKCEIITVAEDAHAVELPYLYVIIVS